jgi:hypothetical protein
MPQDASVFRTTNKFSDLPVCITKLNLRTAYNVVKWVFIKTKS